MAITTSQNEAEIVFHVSGRFDFTCSQLFEELYRSIKENERDLVIDFQHTEYIDSSGIGLLLRMRHELGQHNHAIQIRNCDEPLMRQFRISQFEQFFSFE